MQVKVNVLIANDVFLLNKEVNAPIYNPEDLKNIKKIVERDDAFEELKEWHSLGRVPVFCCIVWGAVSTFRLMFSNYSMFTSYKWFIPYCLMFYVVSTAPYMLWALNRMILMAESDVILSKIILKVNMITIIQKIPNRSLYA